MRKLTASLFIALDGVVDAPQDWHFPYMDHRMQAAVAASMAGTDAFLLGRATFEEWASFWPSQPSDDGMADMINRTSKYVASNTLDSPDWENSEVLKGDAAESVARLKRTEGGEISVAGSGTLVRSLLVAGLVDELNLLVHPIVVGRGKHLFEGGGHPRGLTLVSSEAFESGVVNATYAPAGS